jgi:hypothetical protein
MEYTTISLSLLKLAVLSASVSLNAQVSAVTPLVVSAKVTRLMSPRRVTNVSPQLIDQHVMLDGCQTRAAVGSFHQSTRGAREGEPRGTARPYAASQPTTARHGRMPAYSQG